MACGPQNPLAQPCVHACPTAQSCTHSVRCEGRCCTHQSSE
uniref:Uncharacterized protein n=1 Tax=Arundo donax TaxID=35708 RepID=A0A0A9GYF8_ARUDO